MARYDGYGDYVPDINDLREMADDDDDWRNDTERRVEDDYYAGIGWWQPFEFVDLSVGGERKPMGKEEADEQQQHRIA